VPDFTDIWFQRSPKAGILVRPRDEAIHESWTNEKNHGVFLFERGFSTRGKGANRYCRGLSFHLGLSYSFFDSDPIEYRHRRARAFEDSPREEPPMRREASESGGGVPFFEPQGGQRGEPRANHGSRGASISQASRLEDDISRRVARCGPSRACQERQPAGSPLATQSAQGDVRRELAARPTHA
jgi:hypothetical protein